MNVRLPYGERVLDIAVPDNATVLTPAPVEPLPDPGRAVRDAVAAPIAGPPLARLAQPGQRAAIVISDITRPVPNQVLLPPLLDTLEAAGIRTGDIALVVGTGLHRPSRLDELRRLVGDKVAARYRIVDHDARDQAQHAFFAKTARGTDVWLNRAYLEAELRIVTGFVEPHLFAGYSGGGKAVLPAIAGAGAIMANHDARMIGHPRAIWCTTDGNPIFEEMRDVALKSAPFTVNVTLDERKRITAVFAGELVAAHDAAIAQAERQAVRPIPHLFDVVVVTNMGYPADLNLYQSVKAMSVASQACVSGGSILVVAECREGLGGPEYVDLMRSERSPGALLARLQQDGQATMHDQWQAQVQAMVQARCDVWLHSALDRASVESAHLRYAPDLTDTLGELIAGRRRALGRQPTVCILPYGQLTVARLATTSDQQQAEN